MKYSKPLSHLTPHPLNIILDMKYSRPVSFYPVSKGMYRLTPAKNHAPWGKSGLHTVHTPGTTCFTLLFLNRMATMATMVHV